MSQIHITDGQTDQILDVITAKHIIDNTHRQSLKDMLETFDFVALGDKSYAQHLGKHNRVIIPSEDRGYTEFVIHEFGKYHDSEGLKAEVYTSASYLLLKKAKVIHPTTLNEYTPSMSVGWALNGTEWRPGIIEGSGYRTFNIENHTNPFALLKRIAREFGLELRFRVETNGNRITGRFVNLLERVGEWRGREVEFGRDLVGIKRIEETDIYTALIGLGPIREDGTRLEVLVEDEEALKRWGRPNEQGVLQHFIGVYEPQSSRAEMTLEELTQYTRTELNKRINAVVEYKTDIADLENVPGMENKKIRFGDTIKIKDIKFNPPLYLEARVHTQERDIVDKSKKHVELGDYIEYTEEEVRAIWKSLQAEIRQKVSMIDVLDVTYTKQTIDDKDTSVYQDGTYYADVVATNKASEAEDNAKTHADNVANQAEQNAKDYSVSKEVYEAKVAEILTDLADKAGLEYVNGQLELKADSSLVTSINNTVNDLASVSDGLLLRVSENESALAEQGGRITSITQEIDTLEGTLSLTIEELSTLDGKVQNQQIQINANANAIALKANQDDLDIVSGNVSSLSAEVNIIAGKVELKAEQSALETLEGEVTAVSNNLASLTVDVNGISQNVSSLNQTVDGHITSISNINSSITQMSGQINAKAEQTQVDTIAGQVSSVSNQVSQLNIDVGGIRTSVSEVRADFDGLQIGGRNYAKGTSREFNKVVWNSWNVYHDGTTAPDTEAKEGDVFTARVYYKNIVGSDAGIRLFWRRTNGTTIESNNGSWVKPSDQEGYAEITAVAPSDVVGVKVVLRRNFGSGGSSSADYKELKLEKGRKATDWTPAPEDVDGQIGGLTTRISSAESSITQQANKIALVVTENNAINAQAIASSISLTPSAMELISENIDITGKVTFNSFNASLQNTFNSDGTVKTTRLNGTIAEDQINTTTRNKWNTAANDTTRWKMTGKTTINGGQIETDTITAVQINVNSLSALSANLGNVTAGSIKGVSIEGSEFISNFSRSYTEGSTTGTQSNTLRLDNAEVVFNSNDSSFTTGVGSSNYIHEIYLGTNHKGNRYGKLFMERKDNLLDFSYYSEMDHKKIEFSFRPAASYITNSVARFDSDSYRGTVEIYSSKGLDLNSQQGVRVMTDALTVDGEVKLPNASGHTSISSAGGISFGSNADMLSIHNGVLTVYGNRATGGAFKVRSHSRSSSYRDDFVINSDGSATFNASIYNSGGNRWWANSIETSFVNGTSANTHVYIRPLTTSGEVRVLLNGNTSSNYLPLRASNVSVSSSIHYKSNIEKLSEYDALRIFDNTESYTYHLNTHLDAGIYDKKKVGFISEMSASELRDEDGIDSYSAVATLWAVTKRHQRLISENVIRVEDIEYAFLAMEDDLLNRIKQQQEEINYLKNRVYELEKKVA